MFSDVFSLEGVLMRIMTGDMLRIEDGTVVRGNRDSLKVVR